MATTILKKSALSRRFQTVFQPRSNGTLAPIMAFGDDVSGPIGLTHMPANGQAYASLGNGMFVPFAEAVFGSNLSPVVKPLTSRIRQAYKVLPEGQLAPIMVFGSDASNPIAAPGLGIGARTLQPFVEVSAGIFAPYAVAVINEGATVVERDLDEDHRYKRAYKAMPNGVLAPIVVFGTDTSGAVNRGNKVENPRQAFVQVAPGLWAPFFSMYQDNPVEILTPTNTALPTITGTLKVGEVINLGNGSWTKSPTSYARALHWQNSATVLSTGPTYTVQASDEGKVLVLDVIATNGSGASPTASSLPSATVAPAAVVAPPDTKARWGYGDAQPSDLTALLNAMTPYGTVDGSKAGSFTAAPAPAGKYVWAAFDAAASANGVTFTDALGTGGWQGAGIAGNNDADDGSSPNTSTVTLTVGGVTLRFFRMSYAEAGGTFTTA